jgi:hypothetical protein
VLIKGLWEDAESEAGAGSIRLRAWGENAESLLDPLLGVLQKLPVGQPPEIKRTKTASPVTQPPEIVRQNGSKEVDRSAQNLIFLLEIRL